MCILSLELFRIGKTEPVLTTKNISVTLLAAFVEHFILSRVSVREGL